jgi:alpha-glucosidase
MPVEGYRVNRFLTLMTILVAECLTVPAQAKTVSLSSPDGTVRTTVSDDGGRLHYSVRMDGRPILADSMLGIRADGIEFGEGAVLGRATPGRVDRRYSFRGARTLAVDRARTASIATMSHGEPFTVDVHVADEGVAVRLRLPARAGRHVEADRSTWHLAAANPAIWATSYDASYEHLYRTTSLQALDDKPLSLPLTAQVGGRWVTISDAAQVDYGDMAIAKTANGALAGTLIADPAGWSTDRAVVQPWRVTIITRDLTALVNTTLVQNLNPPPASSLANAPWIRPGRSTWQWLSSGAPMEGEQHQWVNWTQQLGFDYYLIDDGWAAWQHPWETLAETVRYAAAKRVGIWVWVHSKSVFAPEARRAYLRRLAASGVVGVKVDFPDKADHDWSNWYPDFARDAAAEKLMVDFHGATKPTGIERTWPNILTREGVRGHEWHITRYKRVLPPEHDTVLPFTRYIVGPGDYTPTVFDPKELQGNSWSHELAGMVIFTSPFLSLGGNPALLLANPASDIIKSIPAVWDETRVLEGSAPGKRAIFARRTGSDWYIAAINGSEAGTLDVPLSFLSKSTCAAVLLRDADRPDAYAREQTTVDMQSRLRAAMAMGGGFVAQLRCKKSR